MEKETENESKLNLLSYQENVDLFSSKYKFYDITDCKIFSPYTQFKNKRFELEDTKKTKKKYHVVIDDQNKNVVSTMNWKRNLF